MFGLKCTGKSTVVIVSQQQICIHQNLQILTIILFLFLFFLVGAVSDNACD